MKLEQFFLMITFGLILNFSVSFTTEEMKFRHRKSKSHKTHLKKNKVDKQTPQTVNQNSDLAKDSNILDMVPDSEASIVDLKLGPGPLHYKGWTKFFKYSSDENLGNKPSSFFKNMEFYTQNRTYPETDFNQKEAGEYKYIPNESFFYIMVFYDSVNILNSKLDKYQKTFDSLFIDLIAPQVEDKNFIGGITDFGSFSEGFCLKVQTSKILLTEIPSADTPLTSWIFCTETAKEKANLMTTLRKIKIRRQRDQGIVINNAVPQPENQLSDLVSGETPKMKDDSGSLSVSFNSTTGGVKDGYWITLQTWTQCSLKCGGGVSTQQRMCVPPKDGGKPCDGPSILTKPCNMQPCPQVKQLQTVKRNSTVIPKPIVKVMPFSDRPQRYSKCIIKESDLMYTKIFQEKVNNVENVQIPVRVVMNNRTISVFGSSDYESVIVSFELQETSIAPSKPHPNCFILAQGDITDQNIRQAELCPFGMDGGEKLFQSWMYDFNLFKYQCKTDKETIELDNAEARALNDKMQKKVGQAKIDIVDERSNLLQEKVHLNDEKNINQQLMKTNVMAMTAIQKEVTLEDMVKQEEAERESQEETELLDNINEEKEKKECLLKKIEEKEKEDQYNLKAQEAAVEMQNIRANAEKQLKIKRSELKSAILQMRKKAERKKAQLSSELQAVRIQMSKYMGKIYKDGDQSKCVEALKNTDNRLTYCGVNFPDDYVKFDTCKTEDDFCSFCCETEFGDMHMDKRQTCYDSLCFKPVTQNNDGKWIWVSDHNGPVVDPNIKQQLNSS